MAPDTQTRTWNWLDRTAKFDWVFGMRWLPALDARAQKAMQRNLREQGFVWAVNHGKQVRLIGVQPLVGNSAVGNRTASAAVAFASQHSQGTHALCLEVLGIGVWLVAASDGSLLSDTDRWFDTLEQAQGCLQALRERHERLVIMTGQWNPEASDPGQEPPDFLQASLVKHCKFARLPSVHTHWLWWVFLILGAGVGAVFAYQYLLANDQSIPAGDGAFVPRAVQPPSVPVHRNEALPALLEDWHRLPIDPAGWLLQSVACRIDLDRAFCAASYRRRDPGAHNEGLAHHEPAGWRFEPDSLDQAFFKRTIAMPVQPLLPHMRTSTTFGLAQLQRLSPEVAGLAVGHVNQVPVTAPVKAQIDATDSAFDLADQRVERLSLRTVSLRLALRQAERIKDLNLPLRWRQADLSLIHGAQVDQLHGYLMLNLQGEWLETN